MAGPWEQYGPQPGASTEQPPWMQYQAPAATAGPLDPNEVTTRGSILPVGVTRGGQVVPALPDWAVGPAQTIGDIISGKRTADQVTGKEAFDLGMLFGGGSSRFPGLPGAGPVVSDAAAAASRIGVDLPRAVTSTGVVSSTATKVTNAVPIGGAPLRTAARTALDQLDAAATAAKGGPSSMFEAGKTIEQGITDFAARGGDSALSQKVSAAYDKVDQFINPQATADLSNTLAFANQATRNAQAAGIQPGRAVQTVLEAATRPEGLTYQGIKTLRTKVGEWVNSAPLAASDGVSQGEAKAVYAALSKDMESVVQTAGGPNAVAAWQAANAEASSAAEVRASLGKILKTGNEGEGTLFTKLVGMAGSGARADVDTLSLAREAVGDTNWGTVLSAMVEKWGFNERGEFDPAMFANQWSKVTPEAKAALFKTPAERKQAQALDDIATVSHSADHLRDVSKPLPALITGALGLSGALAFVHALEPAHFSAITTAILGSRVVSNVLAKPEGAAAFASWAKAYEGFVASPSQGTSAVLRKASAALGYRASLAAGVENGKDVADQFAAQLAGAPAAQVAAAKAKLATIQRGQSEVFAQAPTY